MHKSQAQLVEQSAYLDIVKDETLLVFNSLHEIFLQVIFPECGL